MNDSIVSTSDIRSVLSQQAYVLFYIRYWQENGFSHFLLCPFFSSQQHFFFFSSIFKFRIRLLKYQLTGASRVREVVFGCGLGVGFSFQPRGQLTGKHAEKVPSDGGGGWAAVGSTW